jgi:hemerythrin superfamily protein
MRQQRVTQRGGQNLMPNFGNWDWPNSRDMMIFGAGMLLSLAASRVAPPIAGRAIGTMRAMAGTDPFDALAQDHQKVLALFEAIEATDNSATTRRVAMLFQLKRMLTAHALAEEDIIYPMIRDDAHRREQAVKLYRDHAEVKVKLFELEHRPKDDPSWMTELKALHHMIESHAREEEQVEFPKLRAALDDARCANLMGEVQREKSMLL